MTQTRANTAVGAASPRPARTKTAKAERRLQVPASAPPDPEHPRPAPVSWVGSYPLHRRPRNFMTARWRWIACVTLAVIAGAAALSYSRTPTYRSSADVLVQPRVFSVGTPPQAPDMGSEKAVAQSATVLDIAAKQLRMPAAMLAQGLSVSVPLNTHVLHISYTSSEPVTAQTRAQAVADAYVRYWISQQPPLTVNTPGAGHRQAVVDSAVISSAKLPSAPASPHHKVDISIAVLIGLAIAIGTAYLRDRLDDRVRGSADLERFAGESVLAVVPPVRLLRRPVAPVLRDPASRGANAYADLATLVARIVTQRTARSVLVTSPVGDSQVAVSANLAVALAEAGQRVVLVYADLRRPLVHEVFDVDPASGLAAVLDGRTDLDDAVQAGHVPDLRVLPAGTVTGNVGVALHSTELRQTLRELQCGADIVVIDAPPVLAGADVATLVDVADVILLAADGRRTTRTQIRAAADRLHPVRARFVGCVLENLRGRLPLPVRPIERGWPRLQRRPQVHDEESTPVGLLSWLETDDNAESDAEIWARPATTGER